MNAQLALLFVVLAGNAVGEVSPKHSLKKLEIPSENLPKPGEEPPTKESAEHCQPNLKLKRQRQDLRCQAVQLQCEKLGQGFYLDCCLAPPSQTPLGGLKNQSGALNSNRGQLAAGTTFIRNRQGAVIGVAHPGNPNENLDSVRLACTQTGKIRYLEESPFQSRSILID